MNEASADPWYRWRCGNCKARITRLAAGYPSGWCPGCCDEGKWELVSAPLVDEAVRANEATNHGEHG